MTTLGSDSGSNPNSPLINEYTRRFKETFSMIEKLNIMGVLPEKSSIHFPKILVVGDESSGKSSVISQLIGLTLPTSIKTPLVVKFELHSSPSPDRKIFLRYEGDADMEISEDEIGSRFQKELETKTYMGFSVVIKQNHVSHLTIVDLPGIKECDGNRQEQENEVERIKGYIVDYTSYEHCVFIDVISASNSTTRYLSTKLISDFDLWGKRTVSVVTKIDQISRDMRRKFTRHKHTTPLGYTFVSNVAFDYKESQLLNVIDIKYFGYTAAATNIVAAMLSILFNTTSFILQQINIHLKQSTKEIQQLNDDLKTLGEARSTFLMIATKSQYTLYKLLIAHDYSEYTDDTNSHAYHILLGKLKDFQTKLTRLKFSKGPSFLVHEIEMLRNQSLPLPSNLLESVFFSLLVRKQVDNASTLVYATVLNMFDYLDNLVFKVVSGHAVDHKRLKSSLIQPVINVLSKTRLGFEKKVARILELEKTFPTTCDPCFISALNKYKQLSLEVKDIKQKDIVMLQGLGEVHVTHLRGDYCTEPTLKGAFDLKMLVCAYWESVSRRIVDNITLSLMESLKDMVTGEMVMTIMEPFMRIGEELNELPNEEPMLSVNRENLTNRTNYLKEVIEYIEKIQLEFQFLLW